MKTNIFFFVSLILCSQAFSTLYKAKESSMEFIVNELVQLNKIAGSETIQIQSLLNKVSGAVNANGKAIKGTFEGINTRCDRGTKQLNDYLKKLRADLLSDNANASSAEGKLKAIAKKSHKLEKDMAALRKSIKQTKSEYAKEIALDRQVRVEAVEKRDVIKRLVDIINDELLNAPNEPKKNGAFVQTSERLTQFKEAVIQLKDKMEKVQDTLFAPLVSALINMATERNFSDQKILRTILQLLAKIDSNIKNFLKKHYKSHKQILALIGQRRASEYKQLRELFNLRAQSQQDVHYHNGIISHSKSSSTLLNYQIGKKTKELKNWLQLCDAEEALGKRMTKDNSDAHKAVNEVRQATARIK